MHPRRRRPGRLPRCVVGAPANAWPRPARRAGEEIEVEARQQIVVRVAKPLAPELGLILGARGVPDPELAIHRDQAENLPALAHDGVLAPEPGGRLLDLDSLETPAQGACLLGCPG